MYQNAIPEHQLHERGFLMFLLVLTFLLFTSTFTDLVIAGIEKAEDGGNTKGRRHRVSDTENQGVGAGSQGSTDECR